MIFTLAVSSRMPLLATFYVLGLIVIVAIAMCWPLSAHPLLLLLAWLVPFFLFSITVIVRGYIRIVRVYSRMAVGLHQRACLRVPRAKPTAPGPSVQGAGVWDRWIDGESG